jgi:hypothetical protein
MPEIVMEGWNYILDAPAENYPDISAVFKTCDPVKTS